MNHPRASFIGRIVVAVLLGPMLHWACLGADGTVWADSGFPDPVPAVKTYEWTVSTAKEPRPALKYRFLVPLVERVAGNATVFYKRAIITFLEGGRNESDLVAWSELPLEKLPLDQVRSFLAQRQAIFDDIKAASLCDTCDWGIRFQDLRGKSVIEVRLMEFQQSRSLARLLRLKARLEIAEKRFDDAIVTLGQSYQLSKDLGTAPIIIGNLVGIAVSAITNETVGELLTMDGAPNLYWALRALPDPLVDIRAAAELESTMAVRVFPFLLDADTAQRSADEWRQLLSETVALLGEWGSRSQRGLFSGRTQFVAMMVKNYPIAKRELLAAGYDRQRIEQMPVGQVIAIYARICHEHLSSENSKWMLVPFAQGYERQKNVTQELIDQGYMAGAPTAFPTHDPLLINTELTYAATQVFQASNRHRIMIAALTAVEAIRMQAAISAGKLPGSLEEITVVPVPVNPATGKPPLYRVVDQRADLLIPPTNVGQEFSGRRVLLRIR
jgi:hypothetical protein